MRKRNRVWLLVLAVTGCDSTVAVEPPAAEPAPVASTAFDPATCGRVAGRVTWNGTIPEVPPAMYGVATMGGSFETRPMVNPNAPRIDPQSKAVVGAVVFLRGIDVAKARPWDQPPAYVELRDYQIVVRQGGAAGRVGFVKRGDAVEMTSAEGVFHILRGRGAAYFSLAFPDADRPLTRKFDQPGRVELTSGAGYYWANAHLFVDDHPYYALTDADGRFAFDRVPAGGVSVVAWHPHWHGAKQERDPETGLVTRQTYAAPLEVASPARVEAGRTANAELRLR